MVDVRLFFTRCAAVGAVCLIPLSTFAQGPPHPSSAQLARLHRLGIPIIGSAKLPGGFTVTSAVPLPGNRSYRIVYASGNKSITFEGGQLGGATASKPPPQKHGFLQKLFGNVNKTVHPGANGSNGSTSSEAEGQGTGAIAAYSPVIGTVHLTPSGPCLHGVADGASAQVHNEQVRVSGCNFDDPQPIIDAYKNARRL